MPNPNPKEMLPSLMLDTLAERLGDITHAMGNLTRTYEDKELDDVKEYAASAERMLRETRAASSGV